MCNMTRQVQKWDGESPQVIWDRWVLYSSRTECCWLPDSSGGGGHDGIWHQLGLDDGLCLDLLSHSACYSDPDWPPIHHTSRAGHREQTNMSFFFLSACGLTQKWMAFGWWMSRRVARLGPYIRSDILIPAPLKPLMHFVTVFCSV